jgi:hypothetical protein
VSVHLSLHFGMLSQDWRQRSMRTERARPTCLMSKSFALLCFALRERMRAAVAICVYWWLQ